MSEGDTFSLPFPPAVDESLTLRDRFAVALLPVMLVKALDDLFVGEPESIAHARAARITWLAVDAALKAREL
jgi:hypothetical protein